MINSRLLNVGLLLGVSLILPVYWHLYQTHWLVENAKSIGVWGEIPTTISTRTNYIDILQKQAKLLGLKLNVQGSTITVQASDPLPIYTFLNRLIQIPTLQIPSFTLKRERGKVTIIIKTDVIFGTNTACEQGSFGHKKDADYFTPRFFYVNAAAEVDGQKQIWVNGQSYGPSCPWPLYHTFDRQTGTVKKEDLRPRLSLTSGTRFGEIDSGPVVQLVRTLRS